MWSFLWYNGRYHSQMHFKWPRKQDSGKNSSAASAHWPRTVLWLQDHPSHSKSQHTDVVLTRDASAHLIVYFCCQKERQTCQTKCTTHLASLEDEWEHLQKYFTMSLFCERATKGKKQEFLNSFITQYNYVFQPKLMLALMSRIPSFHKGKMRSRTNRLSMLAFPCVSKRDISVWKWALKPAWLIQFWFTIVLKMVAETKTNLSPQTTSISPSSLKAPFFLVQLPQWPFYHLAGSKFYFPFTVLVILKNTCTQWLICIHSGNTEINSLSPFTFK